MGGVSSSTNDCADARPEYRRVDLRSDVGDDTCHLKSWDVGRPAGRGGIKTSALQEIGSVDSGGPDFDDDVVRIRNGGRTLFEDKTVVSENKGVHTDSLRAHGTRP